MKIYKTKNILKNNLNSVHFSKSGIGSILIRLVSKASYQIAIDRNDFINQDKNECKNNDKKLNDNAYRKHTGKSVTNHKNVEYISVAEKKALEDLMSQFEGIFHGTTGDYKEMGVSFEIDKDKSPYHAKPYRISVLHTPLIKKAIEEMVGNKALAEYTGNSEWAAPIFGEPKKNNGFRIMTDFRRLNEAIKRNPCPMPTLQDMLYQYGGMMYTTALDIIQYYYAMNIKKSMQKYLVIILPWEKHVFLKIPMGLNISADVFQRELIRLFQGMSFVLIYIDDILIITKETFEHHMEAVK